MAAGHGRKTLELLPGHVQQALQLRGAHGKTAGRTSRRTGIAQLVGQKGGAAQGHDMVELVAPGRRSEAD